MIALPSAVDQQRLLEEIQAAGTPNGPPLEVRIGLFADNSTDLGPRLEEAEWGQSDIPITLDATMQGYLPRRYAQSRMRLYAEVNGRLIPQLIGEKTALLASENPYVTDLLSSSTGSLLNGEDSIKLGRFTEYQAQRPEAIVFDAARRLPYHQSLFDIEPVPGVTLTYAGSGENPGFLAHEPTGGVLSRIADNETVGYDYRDTATNGLVAWLPRPLSRQNLVSPRKYLAADLPDWLMNRPTPPLETYSAVRVFCTGENGRLLWEVIEDVPYTQLSRPVHRGRTKNIPFDDTTAQGPYNGRKRAVREALDIARGISTGEMFLPVYDPLIERADPFQVSENRKDDDGSWDLLWGMRVETYKHIYGKQVQGLGSGSIGTQVTYLATILAEDLIQVPALLVPGFSGSSIVLPPSYHGKAIDAIYFTSAASGVQTQGDTLVFDSSAPATKQGDELVIYG